MREIDPKDHTPSLGKPIRPDPTPPEPKTVGNGVFKDPDGRFRTVIPANEGAKYAYQIRELRKQLGDAFEIYC